MPNLSAFAPFFIAPFAVLVSAAAPLPAQELPILAMDSASTFGESNLRDRGLFDFDSRGLIGTRDRRLEGLVEMLAGDVRAGLMSGDPDERVDVSRLAIHVPPGMEGAMLCMDIWSADAFYHAHIERPLASVPPGDYRVEFPTEEERALESLPADQLAVLARIATACRDGELLAIVPASWSGRIDDGSLWALLNGGDTRPSLVLETADGEEVGFPCQAHTSFSAVLYDRVCPIGVVRGEGAGLRIVRRQRLDTLPSIPLPVLW